MENLYQNLKHLIPEAEREDSVHYLSFPQEDSSLIDEDIEAAVSRMQTVVELGRTARDRAKRPMKYPLRELLVFHQDPKFLESLRPLEGFILSELNIKSVVYRSDMSNSVSLRAAPDFKRLGKSLRGDLKKVSDALGKLTTTELSAFEATGQMTVEGHVLTSDDVRVVREYKSSGATQGEYEVASFGEAFVVLSLEVDQGLLDEGIAREVMNRIQRLRKEIKLVVSDAVVAFYRVVPAGKKAAAPGTHPIDVVIAKLRGAIEAQTNTPLLPLTYKLDEHVVVGHVLTDVAETPFELLLCRPEIGLNVPLLNKKWPDVCKGIMNCVLIHNPVTLKQALVQSRSVSLNMNGSNYVLQLNKEIFLSVADYAKSQDYKW